MRKLLIFGGLLLVSTVAWGFSTTYYSALQAKVTSSGYGTVYAGTTAGENPEDQYATSSLSASQTSTTQHEPKEFFAYAKADAQCSFLGWSATDGGEIIALDNPYKVVVKCSSSSSGSPTTETIFANFALNKRVNVLFKPGINGSYTVNGTAITESSGKTITCEGTISLAATASEGYKFYGWYISPDGGATRSYFSYAASVRYTFLTPTTVYAEFIQNDIPVFMIKETAGRYTNLQTAILACENDSRTIVLVDDGILSADTYVIPATVSLLIPYESSYFMPTTVPKQVTPSNATTRKPYKTLTMVNGAELIVYGVLSVASTQYSTNTTTGVQGVGGPYGFIDMQAGSAITIKGNMGKLYAWGYISGDGKVTVESGAEVYENFQVTDFRGGTATSAMKDKGVFPFQQYYIQNVEAEIEFQHGAKETVHASIYAGGSVNETNIAIIGTSDCMFKLSTGSIIRKYDRMTDRQLLTICENSALSVSNLTMTVYISMSSANYVLPFNNNLTITAKKGSILTLKQDISLLPASQLIVEEGARMVIPSGYKCYVYDNKEWTGKGYVFNTVSYKPLLFVAKNHNNTYGAPAERSVDMPAKVQIDGTAELNGALFTTESGADICSSQAGKVIFNTNAPGATTTKQVTQSGTSITQHIIDVISAKLHNADNSYFATAGTVAGTTYEYIRGRWGLPRLADELVVDKEVNIALSGSVTKTIVRQTGTLRISSGKTLSTDTLILETSRNQSCQIYGSITAQKVYMDISEDDGFAASVWYDIAVPWLVSVVDGIYADGVPWHAGTDGNIYYYDGARRAEEGTSLDYWTAVDADAELQPGRLYRIRLDNRTDVIRFEKKAQAQLQNTQLSVYKYASPTDNAIEAGWNGIANPALFHAYINAHAVKTDKCNYGQRYVPEEERYEVVNMQENALLVGQAVIVQVDSDKTDFSVSTTKEMTTENASCVLELSSREHYTDRICIHTKEDKEENYVIGLDVAKAGVSSKVAQMWVARYNAKLCVNTTALVDKVASCPLGLFVPQAGTYWISASSVSPAVQELYITQDDTVVWNLANGPYEMTLEAGTYTEYELKLVQLNLPVEQVHDETNKIQKILRNNEIYILRGNRIYSVDGRIIKVL